MTVRVGFWPWLRWAVARRPSGWRVPWYVHLWNGVMLARYGRGFVAGVSTPYHGDRHRWWVRLEAPLSGGICWWCGLRCYPGPLLAYRYRPRWLFNRLRRVLLRAGVGR